MSPWQVRPRGGEWEDINDGEEAYKEFNQDSAKCGGYNPTRAMRDVKTSHFSFALADNREIRWVP